MTQNPIDMNDVQRENNNFSFLDEDSIDSE